MWDLYVDYSVSTVGYTCVIVWEHMPVNVKCMNSSAPGCTNDTVSHMRYVY